MMMDLATFEDGLDRFGADLSAWPAADRAAGTTCLAADPAARAALAEAQQVETLLRAQRQAPPALDAFATRAMAHPQARRVPLAARRAGWAAAAAAALVLGLYVGGIAVSQHEDTPEALMASGTDMLSPIDVD